VREVDVDVRRRVGAVRRELDRQPTDHDGAPFDSLDQTVDQRNNREFALGLVLEREGARSCSRIHRTRRPTPRHRLANVLEFEAGGFAPRRSID
jgi:hypothetical protein